MRLAILMLVSSWLAAATEAQADVASRRLEAAAAAFAAKQGEDAAEALLEAWLAIDAVADDSQQSSLSARAVEIGSSATPEFAARLDYWRRVIAALDPAILELLEKRGPSTAWRLALHLPPLVSQRYTARIEEVGSALDRRAWEADWVQVLAFESILIHGTAGSVGFVLKDLPALENWLSRRIAFARATVELAERHLRLKWHRTARQIAMMGIDVGVWAADRERIEQILETCTAAIAEEKYRNLAQVQMTAFRRTCTTHGENRNWDLLGSVWKTPWRGHRALLLSGDASSGDCSIEVELGFAKSISTFHVVLACLDVAGEREYCAAEVEHKEGLALLRLVHVKGEASRELAEVKIQLERRWNFETITASIEANTAAVTVLGRTITAVMPFARGADRATKFGFCVPEQRGKLDDKRREKDDVIRIRNLVVRRR